MSDSNQIQIHLVIHIQNEDLQVDFPFEPGVDNIDEVVEELDPDKKAPIKSAIEYQISQQQIRTSHNLFEPIDPHFRPAKPNNEQSSDDDMVEREYSELLQIQKTQLDQLFARHQRERKALAESIAAHQNVQAQQPVVNNSHKDSLYDDLIVF